MTNLKVKKFLQFCYKQIDKHPFLAKSIFAHIILVVVLYILSIISVLQFEKTQASLSAQVSKMPKKFEIIQATSISENELNQQISAYENHQQKIKQAIEDVKKAKQQAIKKHQQKLKAQEEAKKKAQLEAKHKEELEKQKKLEEERKKQEEAKKKAQLEAKRKAELEKQKKLEEERKKQEEKLRQERLAKAKAEAETAARKQIEQNRAQSAISRYIAEYQDRVGSNWIKDDCRGIYNLPRAIIRNGKFIKLTGTSGNYQCDQSLINAIKNTTPPDVTNDIARKTIQTENISFIFKQN
ncbi:MAG: hypothetical protein Kow0076_0690 [Francisella sp.]